jgi:hypothetical protein
MMNGVAQRKTLVLLLLRGLIGGAIGGLLMMLSLLNPLTIGNSWYFWLLIAYSFFGLPFGLFTGGITGVLIWLVHYKTGARLAAFARVGIGILISLAFWGVLFWIKDSSEYAPSTWQRYLSAVLLFGTITGVVTGLIVGSPAATTLNEVDAFGEIRGPLIVSPPEKVSNSKVNAKNP